MAEAVSDITVTDTETPGAGVEPSLTTTDTGRERLTGVTNCIVKFVRVLVLHSERGAAESEEISLLDLVANPVGGGLSCPLAHPDRRELEHPICRRGDGLLVSLPSTWTIPEGKGEPFAGGPINGETRCS